MILVFGSINADLFFAVDRLPVRGETVLTPSVTLQPGGKGANQAAAAARAGATTRFVGCVGDDAMAPAVLSALADTGCDIAGVRRIAGATGTAAVLVERSGENQIVVASGANGSVSADQLDVSTLGPGTTLVCQMEVPAAETAAALRTAKRAGCRTILNLAPARAVQATVLATVDVLVLNEGEATTLTGRDDPPPVTARRLARDHDLTCVITLGGRGALAVAPDGTGWRIGALAAAVVDTVGAGDAFVGVLAASVDAGLEFPDALRRASVAAGLACTKPGAIAALPDRREIDDRMAELPAAADLGDP